MGSGKEHCNNIYIYIYIYDHHLFILRCQSTFTPMGHKMSDLFQRRFSIFFHVLFGGRFNEIQIHHENLSDYSHYVWTCHIIHSSKCWFYANFKTIINFVEFSIWFASKREFMCFWFIHQLDIKAYENILLQWRKRNDGCFFFSKIHFLVKIFSEIQHN